VLFPSTVVGLDVRVLRGMATSSPYAGELGDEPPAQVVGDPGEARSAWSIAGFRTTVIILVEGRFRLNLADESILLDAQGDYVMWGAGLDRSWRAEDDTVVITVRWPSVP
jgi:quercetin dioxygenase-like cupin family protein